MKHQTIKFREKIDEQLYDFGMRKSLSMMLQKRLTMNLKKINFVTLRLVICIHQNPLLTE